MQKYCLVLNITVEHDELSDVYDALWKIGSNYQLNNLQIRREDD